MSELPNLHRPGIGGPDQDVMLGGAGNDLFIGNGGPDVLQGGAGDDRLIGGEGNDQLRGDEGDDILIGGAGADTFTFGRGINPGPNGWVTFGAGHDTVLGFEQGADKLNLSGLNVGWNSFTFIGSDEFSGSSGQPEVRVVEVAPGVQVVQVDALEMRHPLPEHGIPVIEPDGIADLAFTVFGSGPLTADDFML